MRGEEGGDDLPEVSSGHQPDDQALAGQRLVNTKLIKTSSHMPVLWLFIPSPSLQVYGSSHD